MLEDNFWDILKKARSGLNINIEDLSIKTGISKKEIFQLEENRKKPSIHQIETLAEVLNLNKIGLKKVIEKDYPLPNIKTKKIVKVVAKSFPSNSFILKFENKCIIIDTAGEPDLIIKTIKKNKLTPVGFLITHKDYDHEGGIDIIKKEFDINDYSKNVKIIDTPGHTKDSKSYLINNKIFVGDALFAGSMGGANYSYKESINSVKKILSLDPKTIILPGHGPITRIKEEREFNCFYNIQ